MPQKTNLNISPYYDDFDKADNFYKVLFKPGFPVQARELTSLQSILQNQLESFGSHIFKEGSMVIPGAVTYDNTYFSVKVNPDHLGIDVWAVIIGGSLGGMQCIEWSITYPDRLKHTFVIAAAPKLSTQNIALERLGFNFP